MESTKQDKQAFPNDNTLAQLPDAVRDLCALVAQHDLLELDVAYGDFRLRLKRGEVESQGPVARLEARPAAPVAVAPAIDGVRTSTIKSPLAGIFYRAPSPGAAAFVQDGDSVKVGQTVCIIEAMKLMNEIGSEVHGRIRKILVQNAAVVESGQDLMVVEEL